MTETANNVLSIQRLFAVFDPIDLAADAGALQLLPENASYLGRLETVAASIATLPVSRGMPSFPGQGWRLALAHPVLKAASPTPDTNVRSFTEAFTYFGGFYTVIPGRDEWRRLTAVDQRLEDIGRAGLKSPAEGSELPVLQRCPPHTSSCGHPAMIRRFRKAAFSRAAQWHMR